MGSTEKVSIETAHMLIELKQRRDALARQNGAAVTGTRTVGGPRRGGRGVLGLRPELHAGSGWKGVASMCFSEMRPAWAHFSFALRNCFPRPHDSVA